MSQGFVMKKIVILTAQNMASSNIVRPLIEFLSGDVAVAILPNTPASNSNERGRIFKLLFKTPFHLLFFKFFEIYFHGMLAALTGKRLYRICRNHGVDVECFNSGKSPAFAKFIEEYSPDYVVNASPIFLSQQIIDIPRIATLNCHGGKLPEYRGPANYVWCLLNLESEFFMTIHRMVPQMDAGGIWARKPITIHPQWSIYRLDHAYSKAFGIFLLETMQKILIDGPCEEIAQDEDKAMVRSFPDKEDFKTLSRRGVRLLRLSDLLLNV